MGGCQPSVLWGRLCPKEDPRVPRVFHGAAPERIVRTAGLIWSMGPPGQEPKACLPVEGKVGSCLRTLGAGWVAGG